MVDAHEHSIAVIGMAGRFPGAPDLTTYWSNLTQGIESIRQVSEKDLKEAGLSADRVADPNYVRAFPAIEGATLFDARYFNISAKEVEYIDPQHRIFLECAVHALEDAGCDPKRYDGNIGVFGGVNPNAYQFLALRNRLLSGAHGSVEDIFESLETDLMFFLGGDKDYLSTRVSYKLDLRGPSLSVQTACSTSLVAVHLACQSLLSGECEAALAGGVSATPGSFMKLGYMVSPGMTSADGHCRPFDHRANGTVFGDGVGIVVLKRLDRALADGDNIRAIIRGSAINNDGSSKVGFAAPSLEGQASVVVEAHAVAGVPASAISYVEAHGTGTSLGDPIEVASLTRAFRNSSANTGFCGLGSVKSNLGHLNTAAGVAGLIKVILALENECLPPSINYEAPNPQIDFEQTPFFVVNSLRDWPRSEKPRLAGVNAFGIGGTNAHLVVEEAPLRRPISSRKTWHVLPISAKSEQALTRLADRLQDHMSAEPEVEIADVAHTLATGRPLHRIRRAIVCQDRVSAVDALRSSSARAVASSDNCPAYFMFPGQGTQRLDMGRALYLEEPAYRSAFDDCANGLKRHIETDLREIVFLRNGASDDAVARLTSTEFAQPAIFSVSYAMAALWRSRGVEPAGMIGHSVGEFAAACIAGVLTLEDALKAVALRGRLMQQQPAGKMLVVPMAFDEVLPLLGDDVSVAAINAPGAVVVSGPAAAIAELEAKLRERAVMCSALHTSHAFHSAMMSGAVKPLVEVMSGITLRAPRIPYVSNVSGTWITAEQATNPAYWGEQLRAPVRFSEGVRTILDNKPGALIEVGPGRALWSLARQNLRESDGAAILSSMPSPDDLAGEVRSLNQALGEAWMSGCAIHWDAQYRDERRVKVSLPNYPFEGEEILHRITLGSDRPARADVRRPAEPRSQAPDFILAPYWRSTSAAGRSAADVQLDGQNWLVLAGANGLSGAVVDHLNRRGANVVVVRRGRDFGVSGNEVSLSGVTPDQFAKLFGELEGRSFAPERVVYLWSLDAPRIDLDNIDPVLDTDFFGLMYLVQWIDRTQSGRRTRIAIAATRSVDVVGGEIVDPTAAILRGPWLVAPIEHKYISCLYFDLPESCRLPGDQDEDLVGRLVGDVAADDTPTLLAYRQDRTWTTAFEKIALKAPDQVKPIIRPGGAYLITGGLGDLGLAVASALAEMGAGSLVLTGRTRLPPRAEWDNCLASPDGDSRVEQILARIRQIEAKGAVVIVGTADVADRNAMRAVVDDARRACGQINGVFHAAGLPGRDIIVSRTREDALTVLLPKIAGTLILDELLRDEPLDFVVLFSSLSAVAGGVGMVDYVAGNAFLDAFAVSRRAAKRPPKIVSIDWDIWSEIGIAARLAQDFKGSGSLRLRDGLATDEAIDALMRILQSGLSQVVVSKNLSRKLGHLSAEGAMSGPAEEPARDAPDGGRKETGQRRVRPDISARFMEPSNEIEQVIAEFWATALNLDRVGTEDDFFELGGDSLLAMQMIPKLISRFQIELMPRDLFEGGTVAGIARVIENKLIDEIDALEDA
ncbi:MULTISPECIES: polyketide synthase [unclassified Bradyrhizobium]|uniref:type I polyketide synthase n=1 Tax=unclassified Bradyrhizobium TaxID=2631580 RepID=UPI0028E7D6C4|nr:MULTISPECIES: polyketide synthase [unclassified Bradyrhizobium]